MTIKRINLSDREIRRNFGMQMCNSIIKSPLFDDYLKPYYKAAQRQGFSGVNVYYKDKQICSTRFYDTSAEAVDMAAKLPDDPDVIDIQVSKF